MTFDVCAGTDDEWAAMKASKRKRLTRELQRHRCFICGKVFAGQSGNRAPFARRMLGATEDHVIPRDMGGRTPWNALQAHNRCNSLKGNRPPHPCELIFLAAVNLALRHRGPRTFPRWPK